MKYGYIRVSSDKQTILSQRETARRLHCSRNTLRRFISSNQITHQTSPIKHKNKVFSTFSPRDLHISKKSRTFAVNFNVKTMLATPTRENGYIPMSHNYESEVYYTREEFMDELAKQLGQAYGMNDIREAH